MAVETIYSPRISFSYNLHQPGHQSSTSHPAVPSTIMLDSDVDFEFSICTSSEFEHSSAEELFSNGEILAIGVRRKPRNCPAKLRIGEPVIPQNCPSPPPAATQVHAITGPTLAKLVEMEEPVESPNCSPFWQFRRSRSSSSASSNKSLSLCFLPVMLRSYSAGGSKSSMPKTGNLLEKNDCRKTSHTLPSKKKKKSFGSINGRSNNRISPALNVPLVDVFGCGSLCLNGK